MLEKQGFCSTVFTESCIYWILVLGSRIVFRKTQVNPAHSANDAIQGPLGKLSILANRAFQKPPLGVDLNILGVDHSMSFLRYSCVMARIYSSRSNCQFCKIPFMAKAVLLPHFSQKRAFSALIWLQST